jgi:tetratricopeptide (TPR) repeat protein
MTALPKDEHPDQNSIANIDTRTRNARVVSKLRADVAAAPYSSRYSRDELETMYAIAYSHCTHSRFDVALPLFKLLTIYAPTTAHYISGLGLCLQRLGLYTDAVVVYGYVEALEPEKLLTALRVAECLLSLQQVEEASELLGVIVQNAAHTGIESVESSRAAAMLALLANGALKQAEEAKKGKAKGDVDVDPSHEPDHEPDHEAKRDAEKRGVAKNAQAVSQSVER